ncbi:hypothetical protein I4U23_005802 [Adineta vaga]|nr:hypothetical protein I4U23_005802 [Adineta vaga]
MTEKIYRKTGGVRFSADATDSSDDHEEHLSKNEIHWNTNECSLDLYFGILKLSHIYSMTFDVIFDEIPIQLEIILDHQDSHGLQLIVNQCSNSHLNHQIRYEVEVVINGDTIPGPFHRTFLLKEISESSSQKSIQINVKGKILRENQGTATLKHGVHMKSIIKEVNEDDE